jgi:hypothetical protein
MDLSLFSLANTLNTVEKVAGDEDMFNLGDLHLLYVGGP